MGTMDELCVLDEQLKDAKDLLQYTEELLKLYPDRFSLKFTIKQWKDLIADLQEKKIKEEEKKIKEEEKKIKEEEKKIKEEEKK